MPGRSPIDDLNDHEINIVERLTLKVVEDARTALREAGIVATITTRRDGSGFQIGLDGVGTGEVRRRAEDIVEAVLTAALIKASTNAKLH